MTIRISRELPLLNFERLDILCPRIGHPCETLRPFKFSERFWCSILSFSIYHGRRSYIRVKGYGHLNFLRASVVQFCPSRYIKGVDHTLKSKVRAVWIFRELLCSTLRVSIYDARESDNRVKSYSHLNFSRASVVQFWASRYIMGVNHTFESKVRAAWICREVLMFKFERLDISRASIIHSSQKLGPLEFAESFRVQFRGSRYRMHKNRTFE